MKKIALTCIAVLGMIFITGCASVATKPVEQRVPQSALNVENPSSLIYLTDTQSIPTSVLEQSIALLSMMETNDTGVVAIPKSIPVDVIIGVINSAMQLAPQLNEQYIESRKVTGTVSREAYIVGFDDKEAIQAIKELIEAWAENNNKSIINNHR